MVSLQRALLVQMWHIDLLVILCEIDLKLYYFCLSCIKIGHRLARFLIFFFFFNKPCLFIKLHSWSLNFVLHRIRRTLQRDHFKKGYFGHLYESKSKCCVFKGTKKQLSGVCCSCTVAFGVQTVWTRKCFLHHTSDSTPTPLLGPVATVGFVYIQMLWSHLWSGLDRLDAWNLFLSPGTDTKSKASPPHHFYSGGDHLSSGVFTFQQCLIQ